MKELRYALRLLIRNPGSSLIVILTLALAIGANTAIFRVVNAVLFEPLPYSDPDRLVRIWGTWIPFHTPQEPKLDGNVNPVDGLDWRDQAQAFESLAIFHNSFASVTGDGEPLRVANTRVTSNFFPALGVSPHGGRFFRLEEEQAGKSDVAVLSYGFWQRRYGADPHILGRIIRIQDTPFTIIGIAPRSFRNPVLGAAGQPELWRPLVIDRTQSRGAHYMHAVARLKPGITVVQAQSDIDRLSTALQRQFPETNSGFGGRVELLRDAIVGRTRRTLLVLLGAVALVLLIACVNVANLFLARALGRRHEMAVRVALGARRKRVVGQLLLESLTLATLGALFGMLISTWLGALLTGLASSQIPRLEDPRLDGLVLLFTIVLTLLTTLAFGLAPALLASRAELSEFLKGTRSLGLGQRGKRFSRTLVIAEVAMSLVLLIGAGLMIRSFSRLRQTESGLEPRNLIAIDLTMTSERYEAEGRREQFYRQLRERLEAIPGVASLGMTNILPFGGSYSCDGYSLEGDAPVADSQLRCVEVRAVTAGYLETLGTRLLQGRTLHPADRVDGPLHIVINESLARQFPRGQAIGKRLKLGPANSDEPFRTVVGVIEDIRHFGLEEPSRPELYVPLGDAIRSQMVLAIRVHSDGGSDVAGGRWSAARVFSLFAIDAPVTSGRQPATTLLPVIRRSIWEIDPELPLNNVNLVSDLVSSSIARSRFRTVIVAVFASLALVMAAVGIYGVMSYSVSSRTQEFGVLMALGADRHDVLREVMRTAASLTLIGVLIGMSIALLVTPTVSELLYKVTANDPLTFTVVPLFLMMVALVSSLIPALRATRVDPIVALRLE